VAVPKTDRFNLVLVELAQKVQFLEQQIIFIIFKAKFSTLISASSIDIAILSEEELSMSTTCKFNNGIFLIEAFFTFIFFRQVFLSV